MGFWLGIRFPNAAMTGTEEGEGGGREGARGNRVKKKRGRNGTGGGGYVNNTREPWIPLHLYGVTLWGRTVNLGLP